jgi:hypothetical protein
LVHTTSDSRISGGGDIVPSVNLIIDSRTSEENVDSSGTPTPSSMPPPPPSVYDPDHLSQDPVERLPIVSYPINDQDAVRRAYILKGSFKPYANAFKKERVVLEIGHSMLHGFTNIISLNIVSRMMPHFALYAWGGERNPFTHCGWRNWNRDDALDKHVSGVDSAHNAAQEMYNSYLTPSTTIDNRIVEVGSEEKRLYKIRLTYSLRCLRFLSNQELSFVGMMKVTSQ